MSLSSGLPRLLANNAVVTVVSASACVRLVVAATRGHFMSTNAHANSYHDISLAARRIDTGRPDATSNASPLLAAETSSDRKLSASALCLNGSCHALSAVFQRT
jgi:hypothetical protein